MYTDVKNSIYISTLFQKKIKEEGKNHFYSIIYVEPKSMQLYASILFCFSFFLFMFAAVDCEMVSVPIETESFK